MVLCETSRRIDMQMVRVLLYASRNCVILALFICIQAVVNLTCSTAIVEYALGTCRFTALSAHACLVYSCCPIKAVKILIIFTVAAVHVCCVDWETNECVMS
jgi:hypothetical protein